MATNNYLKVRRPGTTSAVEFFFDARHVLSRTQALHAARNYASEATARLRDKDPEADPAVVSVYEHGVEGFGEFPCVGGCDICAPRIVEEVETEPEGVTP